MIWALLTLLVGASGLDEKALELAIWGGPPGTTRFKVSLTAQGHLTVLRESLPITSGGLTKNNYAADLRPEATRDILDIAGSADDFAAGCDDPAVADGTNADLVLREEARHCRNAARWPTGVRAKALVEAINHVLPEPERIY